MQVGAIRSNAQGDQTAILMRVDNRREDGQASRVSVLTISAKSSATGPLTVVCHNGSAHFSDEMRFWRRVAGTADL